MEAYKIWATLGIKGDAQEKLLKILETSKRVSSQFTTINRLMKFNEGLSGIETATRRINRLSSEVDKLTRHAHRASAAVGAIGAGGGRSGAGGGGGGRGGIMGGALLGAAARGAGLGILGGGVAGVAYGAGQLLGSSFRTGSSYQSEMALLLAQNIPGLNKSAVESFLKNTRVRGASQLDMLQALTDAAVITKGGSEAMGVAPTLARMKYLGKAFGTENFQLTSHQLQAAIKTAEIVSGSRSPDVLNRHLEMMMQTMVSTGFRVKPEQYQSIVRSMRGYAKGLDPEFFYYMLEPLIQEFGTRVGPATAQFFQHMRVGRLTTQGAQILGQLGLVNPKDVELNKMGMIKGIKPGGIIGGGLMGSNPFGWIDQYLVPALNKGGYKTPDQQMGILGKIFTNTDLGFVLTYLQQSEKFKASAAANRGIGGMGSLENQVQGLNSAKMAELSAAFSDLKLAIDKFDNPVTHAALDFLTTSINVLTQTISFMNHPIQNIQENLRPFNFGSYAGSGGTLKDIFTGKSSSSAGTSQFAKVSINVDGKKLADTVSRLQFENANLTVDNGTMSNNTPYIPTSVGLPAPSYGSFSS